jgi:hypothetical protein
MTLKFRIHAFDKYKEQMDLIRSPKADSARHVRDLTELSPDQKLLVKDLELIEHMVYKDTTLLIHVGRIKDKAAGGYYHLGRKKVNSSLDQALNEGDGVYRV